MPQRAKQYRPRPPRRPPDTNRPDATQRGYGRRWRAFRLAYLADHPQCVRCLERGLYVDATVVDHVTPHKGDQQAFWAGPFQALCEVCHNRKSARE